MSDPTVYDYDNDGLNDISEKQQATSPWAYNSEPTLEMYVEPYSFSPNGDKDGIYSRPASPPPSRCISPTSPVTTSPIPSAVPAQRI